MVEFPSALHREIEHKSEGKEYDDTELSSIGHRERYRPSVDNNNGGDHPSKYTHNRKEGDMNSFETHRKIDIRRYYIFLVHYIIPIYDEMQTKEVILFDKTN